MSKTLHVQVSDALYAKIEKERARLEKASPGARVTVSDTVRSCVERALKERS